MNPAQVVIEISPSRIELAVLRRGEVIGARSLRSAQPDWGGAWPDELANLQTMVAAWVNELAVGGARATVLYSMSTTATGVMSCPVSVGEAAGQRAALLALGGVAGFALANHPHETQTLMHDTEAQAASGNEAAQKQSHTLAAADTEATAALVADFVSRCGLIPRQLIPTSAIELAACVAEVESLPTCGAVLWVGEHGTVLAAGHRGGLRFVRTLSIGLETLVDAMTRPGRGRSGEVQPPLDRAKAREVLATVGVPDHRHAEYASLVPMMTPVLQRLANEVKQSLRFGLSEQERSSVTIRVSGAAAKVARLGEVLKLFSGAEVQSPSEQRDEGATSVGATSANSGAIAWWRSLPRMTINLAPASIIAGSRSRSIRRAAYAGLGVCAVVIALEAGWAHFALSRERAFLDTERQSSAALSQRAAMQTAATAAMAQQRSLESRVRHALGQSTDWSSVLALLSASTPSSVRLLNIEMTATGGQPLLQIAGIVKPGRSGSNEAAASAVKAYADALSASTLVQGVKMGAATRGSGDHEGSLRFELQATLVGVPTNFIGSHRPIAEGSPR